jgi:hypothetical protein
MAESYIKKVSAGGGRSKINYTNAFTTSAPVYSSPSRISSPTTLSAFRSQHAAAHVPSFVLFAGGNSGASGQNSIDAFNSAYTRSTPTSLSQGKSGFAGFRVGDNAVFAGGFNLNQGSLSSVDSYNNSLTRTTLSALGNAVYELAPAAFGNIVLIGGGWSGSTRQSIVYSYNSSLTRSNVASLGLARGNPAGGSNSSFALFTGGNASSGNTNFVDAYNTSLSRSSPTTLSFTTSSGHAGAGMNSHALFAGGNTSTVNAYDTSLTRTIPTSLPNSTYGNPGVGYPEFVLISDGSSPVIYNSSLVRSTTTNFSPTGRIYMAASRFGNDAVFGGGQSNTIDIYRASITSTNYTLTTPTLSDFVITYNYTFNNIGSGTASEGQTLGPSTSTFTGFLELPEEVT